MRVTSIIFLVLAVILGFFGVILCGIGENMAAEQGIELFDQVADANDNLIYTYNYAGDGIKKVAIEVGDCDVNIIGGSETAYIELVNFAEGAYDLSSTNLTLSVVDNSNLLKLFAWGSEGINFHGFRHYLRATDYADKPRTINVYLTDDSAVKQFDCKLGAGELSMQDISLTFDLVAEVSEGSISLSRMATSSDISLRLGTGRVYADTLIARSLTIEGDRVDTDLNVCYTTGKLTVNIDEGDVALDTPRDGLSGYRVDLNAPGGTIDYFGREFGTAYATAGVDESLSVTINAGRGDIVITLSPGEGEDAETGEDE